MATTSSTTNVIEGLQQGNPKIQQNTNEPRVGILRRPTVQFDHAEDPANQGDPGSPIIPIKDRAATFETEISRVSSKLEPSWRKQTVLSFGE
jgi:hypothetical protein